MARPRRTARRGAQRQGRELAGGHRARRRGDPARGERPLRGVRRGAGLPEGLSRAAQHVRRRPPQHDARLSRSSDQVGAVATPSARPICKEQKPIPHEIVDDGPIFENIVTGDAIDVTKFPSPVWHEKDGGRYIGTGTYSITRDPEENWLNAGAYRAMVHDKTSVGMLMAPGHHAAIHCEKYFKRGEPMPVAMVLGGDPLCFFYGGLEAPYGMFEIDVVGGLRGKADEDGEGQGHRPAVPGRRRDRAGGLCHARTSASSKARSANGPATTPAAPSPARCSTSRRSITATIRSCSACRRWAAARTRWRATAR